METAVGDGLAFTGTGIGHIAIWTMYRIKKAEEPKPLEQSGMCILQDAQWCILRGAKQTAVIAKGGNNGESHNHNDVGVFSIWQMEKLFWMIWAQENTQRIIFLKTL